jgi:trigger factor
MTTPEPELDQSPDIATEGDTAAEEKKELSLDVKVDIPSACQRHVTVTIAREDVDRYLEEAFTELMPKANVPGFRPGRAPRKLVEGRFRDEISDQVKGALLMDSMAQVSEQQNFSAISQPDVDVAAVEVPKEGPMTFEFTLEVRPEFDLPKWKGLKLERPVRKFTKKDVQDHLREILRRHGLLVRHSGAAEDDDYVVVDITCRHNGKVTSEANKQTIRICPTLSFRDANLKDFNKLMRKVKAGEARTATVTVSQDASDSALRGQEVEVSFEVLDVKKLSVPELDETFLKKIGGFAGEGELLDAVKNDLERQLVYYQQKRVRQQITSLLTESANWELPPDMLRKQAQRELDRAVMELESSGFTREQIRTQANVLRQNSQAATATALKEHFILERIAEEENLEVEEADYDAQIALIAHQSDESPRSVRARLEKRGLMDVLRNQIIERKAINLITSHATFKEVKFDPPRHEASAIEFAIGGEEVESDIPDAKHGGDVRKLPQPVDHT